MRRLNLDFQPRKFSAIGLALLAAGLLLAGATFLDYQTVARETDTLRREMDRLQEPSRRQEPRTGDDRELQSLAQAAETVAQDIRRPWEELFTALENAKNEDVALLAVNPDPVRGLVQISGEAKRREAILGFIDRLSKSPGLRNVFLVEEEVQQQDPEKPVRFLISADWGKSRA